MERRKTRVVTVGEAPSRAGSILHYVRAGRGARFRRAHRHARACLPPGQVGNVASARPAGSTDAPVKSSAHVSQAWPMSEPAHTKKGVEE